MDNYGTSSYNLDGLVGLVTGAAQGLGLGISKELAKRNACVVMTDVQEKKLREVVSRLQDDGLNVQSLILDVSDSSQVNNAFREVMSQHQQLDILVNNAGLGQTVMSVGELSDEEWNKVLTVTLTGTFYCCRAAVPILERQGSGVIVNLASVAGQSPAALVAAYNVAKAGVIRLTKTLALELAAYGVRVNAVSPGPIYTDFNKKVMAERAQTLNISEEEMISRVGKSIPLGRWGEPKEIAEAVAFLCSPSSAWITGEVLRVSGGLEGVSATPPRRSEPLKKLINP